MKVPGVFVPEKSLEQTIKELSKGKEEKWEATAVVAYFFCEDIKNDVFIEYNKHGDTLRVGGCYKYEGKACKCRILSFYNHLDLKGKD